MREKQKRKGRFYVYMVECCDGTYYAGSTNNLEKRIKEHNISKRRAKYLRGKLPVRLVWHKEYKYYKRTLIAERAIKKLSHRQKEELVRIYERNK